MWMFPFVAVSLEPGPMPGTEQVHTLWMNEWNEWKHGCFAFIWQNNVLTSITTKNVSGKWHKTQADLNSPSESKIYLNHVYLKGLQLKCPCWCGDYLFALTVQCREFVTSQVVSLTISSLYLLVCFDMQTFLVHVALNGHKDGSVQRS